MCSRYIFAIILLFFRATTLAQEDDYPLTFQPYIGDPSLDPVCPARKDIYPCFCYIVDDHLMNLDCSNILDESELLSAFSSRFPETRFNKLHFDGNKNIQVMLEGIFNNISFAEVILHDGNLKEVERRSLKSSFKTATKLDFVSNKLHRFPFEELPMFSSLKDLHLTDNLIEDFPVLESSTLETLSLAYNPIGVLPSDAFEELPKLVSVDLDHTRIAVLHPGTFSPLPSLAYLFLGDNDLSYIGDDVLAFVSSNVSIVSLSHNHITTMNPVAISGLPPGVSLYLDNNGIEHLHENNWKPLLQSGVQVWLTDNPLICNCEMNWIIRNKTFQNQIQMASCEDGPQMTDLTEDNFDMCSVGDDIDNE